MKLLIAVCALVAVAAAVTKEEFRAQLTEIGKTCTSDQEVLQLVLKTFVGDFPDNEKVHCPLQCILKKIQFLKENGDLNGDFVVQNPPPGHNAADAKAAVEKCKGSAGATECERAYNIAKCLYPELH